MNKIEKKVLKTFITLMREKIIVHRVVLFGSRARGDADVDADMDVLVIVDDFTDLTEDFISQCAWEAGFENDKVSFHNKFYLQFDLAVPVLDRGGAEMIALSY